MNLKSQLARTKKAEAARAVKNKTARLESTIITLKADLAEARAVIGRVREMVDSTLARPIGEFSIYTSPKDFARQVDTLLPAPATEGGEG